jgi:hydrophobic/amphiphilic exporter-1 (mainly G- bacteria), HAE1 family
VFLPTAFISGLQGTFYKQFAITIAASTMISAFVSLTLSPALAAVLLKPHRDQPRATRLRRLSAPIRWLFTKFNAISAALSKSYSWLTRQLIRISFIVLIIYGGLIALAYRQLSTTPTGLIPQLDRGYLIAAFQLPPGASLDRTDEVIREAIIEILQHPAVLDATAFVGFDGATFTNAPNTGAIFFTLKSFEERARRGFPATRIVAELRRELSRFKDAFVIVLEPPSVPGIGTGGGLKGFVQNRIGQSFAELERVTGSWLGLLLRRLDSRRHSRCSTRARRKSSRISIAPSQSC